jgi:hypothetical protein
VVDVLKLWVKDNLNLVTGDMEKGTIHIKLLTHHVKIAPVCQQPLKASERSCTWHTLVFPDNFAL